MLEVTSPMVTHFQNTPWNRFEDISPPGTQTPTLYPHLFSVEQKNCTQGLVLLLSEEGGRYMASEKQVSNSFSSSVLEGEVKAWSHSGAERRHNQSPQHVRKAQSHLESPIF